MAPLPSVRLAAAGCITAFGDADATHAKLLAGERALATRACAGIGRRRTGATGAGVWIASLDETAPPNWLASVKSLAAQLPDDGWGTARSPVFVTSSNFGVGSLYAYRRHGDPAHLAYGTPHACVEWLGRPLGWGSNVSTVSHACVSAHLGLLLATRACTPASRIARWSSRSISSARSWRAVFTR